MIGKNDLYIEISKSYSKMSSYYDISEGLFERYFGNLGIRLLEIQPDDKILELGPGTGTNLMQMVRNIENGFITAIEGSTGMLNKIAKKMSTAPENLKKIIEIYFKK